MAQVTDTVKWHLPEVLRVHLRGKGRGENHTQGQMPLWQTGKEAAQQPPSSQKLLHQVTRTAHLKSLNWRGAWVARPVERLTLARVMTLFVGSSPASGSVLPPRSLEPASDSVSPSLPLPRSGSVSPCLSKTNQCQKQIFFT